MKVDVRKITAKIRLTDGRTFEKEFEGYIQDDTVSTVNGERKWQWPVLAKDMFDNWVCEANKSNLVPIDECLYVNPKTIASIEHYIETEHILEYEQEE